MEWVFRIALFITGIINIIPSVLAFLPDKIPTSYGIDKLDSNLELLLRHRAILFGIIGGCMIFSALSKRYYEISVIAGLVSMASFVVLYFLANKYISPELRKVMLTDVAAIVILSAATILFIINGKSRMN